ncbi:sorting nexin-27-like [Hydractinia symbiolongicarpus]|uniref:sorting nexin-27-like n=1 Tax=Hydractinia symbiolongicarpus TaxID=13093 RepID=UPI002550FD0C|nr:sorting nexin-27-like [Hydractinia symbiolongicarpus]
MADEKPDLEDSMQDDDSSPVKDPYGPRVVKIRKGERGFGFNVRGQVSEGGQLRSINGTLYPPLQMISAVLDGGPADRAGVLVGDRILMVNNENCEGADHRKVVDLIRQGENALTMAIISVTPSEARKLDGPADVVGSRDYIDYSERKSVPITIPDFRTEDKNGEKYVVYNVYISGSYVCARRYKEFAALHAELKRRFRDYPFPKFPSKWPFSLSEQQLDARRRGLESYIEEVAAVRVIGESEILDDFLKEDEETTTSPSLQQQQPRPVENQEVEFKINLPNKSSLLLTVSKKLRTAKVYEAVVKKAGLTDFSATFFGLFEIVDNGFERKLEDAEFPHRIITKYAQSNDSHLALRKWIFTVSRELKLTEDTKALNLIYGQAIDDIRKGLVLPGDQIQNIKELKSSNNIKEFLDVARTLVGYGTVKFPHCKCDARKEGHVIVTFSITHMSLNACSTDGIPEDQEHVFNWDEITSWDADTEAMCFWFEYQKPGKKKRQVRIFSKFFTYMGSCVIRIMMERSWCKKDKSGNPILPELKESGTSVNTQVSIKKTESDAINDIDDGDL